MRTRKTLSNWLTTRYLLIIRNEENFAEKTTLSFTYAKVLVFLVTLFVIFMMASLYMSKTILAQWFDPRHAQLKANKQLIQLSLAIDSLSQEVDRKDQFINNFQSIVNGEDILTAEIGSLGEVDTSLLASVEREIDINKINPIDSQLRREFEELELFTVGYDDNAELQEIFFFSPISGIISGRYNPQLNHYGVDVVSKENEPVKCVADGTVLFADFDFSDSGYVIAIQHRSNLISIYKHNSAILKKVGNFVSAGEIISIIGNTGELTSGPHLHFELWFNGNSVNPEEFVTF